MSEIFSFQKKNDAERGEATPEAGQPVVSLVPEADTRAKTTTQSPAEPAIAETFPPARPIRLIDSGLRGTEQRGRFDLSSADRQIRNVLDPLTIVGEQFRLLRSKLGLMRKQRGIKTVLVTSTCPQEGKTFAACGLASVIAQEPGKRVVLIDADMRKPRAGRGLGLEGEMIGLSHVLSGEVAFDDALLQSTSLDFCFLPSGPVPPNPTELLSSSNLERTLRTAAESFDWIIVDSPPVLGLSDATLIAHLCDTVLLVIRANVTPSKLVVETVKRIGRDRICGVVMNRQKHAHSSHYYGYYHKNSKRRKN